MEGGGAASAATAIQRTRTKPETWIRRQAQHLSFLMSDDDDGDHDGKPPTFTASRRRHSALAVFLIFGIVGAVFAGLVASALWKTLFRSSPMHLKGSLRYVPVEEASEQWLPLELDDGENDNEEKNLTIWFRTWGRSDGNGIPVVFVHGGPGNAIADYFGNGNNRFFGESSSRNFFVVEIDQRGTGNSRPSVRHHWTNMKYYEDITIDKMVDDFEQVRKHLGIDRWLVWGGSFGSTLSINYGQRYPRSCLALILRGIYLDSKEEVYAVYSRKTYLKIPKRLREFDILYEYAAKYVNETNAYAAQDGEEEGHASSSPLDPNDAERLMRVYAEMITSGDKRAIWHWFVFENNLMELDPEYILDPDRIDDRFLPEATSIAFFETRLWIHGSFEEPTSNLLDPSKIGRLEMPMWVCQGQGDEVCPPKYARRFVGAVQAGAKSPRVVSRFLLNATHEDTDPALEECLRRSLKEFEDVVAT